MSVAAILTKTIESLKELRASCVESIERSLADVAAERAELTEVDAVITVLLPIAAVAAQSDEQRWSYLINGNADPGQVLDEHQMDDNLSTAVSNPTTNVTSTDADFEPVSVQSDVHVKRSNEPRYDYAKVAEAARAALAEGRGIGPAVSAEFGVSVFVAARLIAKARGKGHDIGPSPRGRKSDRRPTTEPDIDYPALDAELEDLESTDPDVHAAAMKYDAAVEHITGRKPTPRKPITAAGAKAYDDAVSSIGDHLLPRRPTPSAAPKLPAGPIPDLSLTASDVDPAAVLVSKGLILSKVAGVYLEAESDGRRPVQAICDRFDVHPKVANAWLALCRAEVPPLLKPRDQPQIVREAPGRGAVPRSRMPQGAM